MMSKNERLEKLNKAGINTDKYFTVDLDNGARIHLIIDEHGNFTQVKDDIIAEQIIEDGYVRNTRLHRRFVCAQMFKMLNYSSKWNGESGFHGYLNNCYGYEYTFKMMLEEVKVLSKLEVRDSESFAERSHFFTKEVVQAVMNDYVNKLKVHVDALPTKKCKGVPYKRIKGQNIFVEDLSKKLYNPLIWDANRVRYAQNYGEVYKLLKSFMDKMVDLHWKTAKSKAWIDAFKGEGAYYTMKNLIMYHDCKYFDGRTFYNTNASMNILKSKLNEYQDEGWRMFAMMKKLIDDNQFDFNKRMEEIYNQ